MLAHSATMWRYFFEMRSEFKHLPLKQRRAAAAFAEQQALRHWQVILTFVFLCASVVGFSILDTTFRISDRNGTDGATFGFFVGLAALHWAFYRYGLPYYRAALQQHPKP